MRLLVVFSLVFQQKSVVVVVLFYERNETVIYTVGVHTNVVVFFFFFFFFFFRLRSLLFSLFLVPRRHVLEYAFSFSRLDKSFFLGVQKKKSKSRVVSAHKNEKDLAKISLRSTRFSFFLSSSH